MARSKDLLDKLQHENPDHIRALAGDLSDPSLPTEAVSLAVKEFGKLDAVIINHGTMDPVARIANSNQQDWSRLFTINFFSAVAFVSLVDLISEMRD